MLAAWNGKCSEALPKMITTLMSAFTGLERTEDEAPAADKITSAVSSISKVTVEADRIITMLTLLMQAQTAVGTVEVDAANHSLTTYIRHIGDALDKFIRALGADCTPELKMASILSAANIADTTAAAKPWCQKVASLSEAKPLTDFFNASIMPLIIKETTDKFEAEKGKFVAVLLSSKEGFPKDAWHEIRDRAMLTTLISSWAPLPMDTVSAMAQLLGKPAEISNFSCLEALNNLHLAALKMRLRLLSWDTLLVLDAYTDISFSADEARDLRNLDQAVLQNTNTLKGIPEAMAEELGMAAQGDRVSQIMREGQQKFIQREDRKCKTAISMMAQLYPVDWQEMCFPEGDIENTNKGHIKEFINSEALQSIGDVSTVLARYKDSLTDFFCQSGILQDFFQRWTVDDKDEDKKGALTKLTSALQKSRAALCGAKAAKVYHFKVPKILKEAGGKATASTNREKKRLIKSVKDSIEEIGGNEFPAVVMQLLNTL